MVCIYYGGEWPNKLRLSEHRHRGYMNAPFYLDSAKHVQLPIYLNFKSPHESKKLKQMLANHKAYTNLPLNTQLEVDQE
jgi:hypothetical protein